MPMDRDAPSPPSLADRLSGAVAAWDPAVNALHDRLNEAIPWLWRPLDVPAADRRLAPPEHALYGAHAAIGLGLAAAVLPRPLRRPVLVAGALVAAGSWAVFTGAWDRRADRAQADVAR